jgi:hypothetical protein
MIHRPIWVFALNLRDSLTVLGLWPLMESGEFALNRRPPPQVVQWRKRQNKKDPQAAQPGLLVDSAPTTIVVFHHKSGWKVIALDANNYFPESNVPTVTCPDGESSSAINTSVPAPDLSDSSARRLCELRDRVVELALWHRKQELGRFAFSAAGIALAGFRHRFMHVQPDLPEDQDERDWQRTGFYQGRTEAFWFGTVEPGHYTPVGKFTPESTLFDSPPSPPFHLLDARAFYGAVYQFCSVPVACVESSADSRHASPELADGAIDIMGTVLIDSATEEFPVRHEGLTRFATGRFVTTLAGPELDRAHKAGVIVDWLRWERYQLELLLRPFSLALWQERENFEKGGSYGMGKVVKRMLASLYGKFLQRATRWENRPELFSDEAWGKWWDISATTGEVSAFRAVAHDVQEEVPAGDAPHCFPAIAAWVTSHGREWLRSWIKIAGYRNVLYVATDSLIVTDQGRANLENSGIIGDYGIGSLRVVQTSDRVRIDALNNYEVGPVRKHGGTHFGTEGIVGSDGTAQEQDSLKTILFVRRGREAQTRTGRRDPPAFFTRHKIGPGGWVATPSLTLDGGIECCS